MGSIVLLMRRYTSRRSSTEQQNSASSRQTSLNTSVSHDSIDEGRMSKPRGCGIDDGYDSHHRRASGEVARPLPVIAAPRSPKICPRLHLDYAWPDLADKASEPSRATSYPLSYLSWQGLAKSSARSEQMASWFTEWVCHADVMQALAGFSAFLGKETRDAL